MAERYTKKDPIPKAERDTPGILFERALALVQEHGHYEEARPIIDYTLAEDGDQRKLTNYRFDFRAVVNPGCEGIYIDCYLHGEFDQSGKYNCPVGVIKTLREDVDAYRIMGALTGLSTVYAHKYVDSNIDRYTPDKELEAMTAREEERQKEAQAKQLEEGESKEGGC